MSANVVALGYLVAAICFVLALRGLSSPATSQQGNRIGIAGMAVAILFTLFTLPHPSFGSYFMILLGLALVGALVEPVLPSATVALASLLASLLEDREARAQMASAALTLAHGRYGLAAAVAGHRRLYEELRRPEPRSH